MAWVEAGYGVGALDRLRRFAAMVAEENTRQNLISPATVATIWSRHIVDSLQLTRFAHPSGRWLDVGTGGGFPGLAVAIAGVSPITLCEPRRRRAEFLRHCADVLGCVDVDVHASKVENVRTDARTISARAVASIENLLLAARHCATTGTRWLLPRGEIDHDELATIASRHRLVFHVEQSVTQLESSIVILEAK